MRLHHRTEVAAGPADVWDVLQDPRAVAGCLPGADRGILRVGIGPLRMTYTGDVTVAERDSGDRRIVLDATGRDSRGSGAIRAHVRLRVSPYGRGARIDVLADLGLTGRIASLGHGVRDASDRMFAEFTERLAHRVGGPAGPAGPPEPAPAYAVGGSGENKVPPLLWNMARERSADLLDRLSERVRPR